MKALINLGLACFALAKSNLQDCALESADIGNQNGWWASDVDELRGLSA